MSSCREMQEILSAGLDGETFSAEQAALTNHLSDCESCRELRAALLQLDQSLWSHFRSGELTQNERAYLRRGIRMPSPARSRPSLRRVTAVLIAAAAILTVFSLLLRSPAPPPSQISQLVVLKAGESITAELSGCSRFVCLGPSAYTTSPADGCRHGAIALVAGTLEVEHMDTDEPIAIHVPQGVFALDHGVARLEVPWPETRSAARILLLSGAATFDGGDDAFDVAPGVVTLVRGGGHQELAVADGEHEQRTDLPAAGRGPSAMLVDESGQAMPGVAATLCSRRSEGLGFNVVTLKSDREGRIALPTQPRALASRLDIAPTASTVARRVSLDSLPADGSVVLSPGGVLAGRVLDAEGEGVPGATVTVRSDDGLSGIPFFDGGSRTVSTAADGSFQIAAVGPVLVAIAGMPGFAPSMALRGVVRNHEARGGLVLRMARAGRLEGVVKNDAGLPLADAVIYAQEEPGLPRLPMDFEEIAPPSLVATSDASGRFSIDSVPLGVGFITWARAPGHLNSEVARFHLKDAATQSLEFVLPQAFSISGRISTSAGEPVSKALVHVLAGDEVQSRRASLPTLSAADGSFRVDGLAPGRKLVVVKTEGLAPAVVECDLSGTPHDQEVPLVADQGVTLNGKVVGRDSEPMPGAMVSLHPIATLPTGTPPALQALLGLSEMAADEQGQFAFRGLRAGRYQLVLSDSGSTVAEQTLELSAPVTETTLAMAQAAPRARLSLTILTPSGKPAPLLVIEGVRQGDAADATPFSFRHLRQAGVAQEDLLCLPGVYVLGVRAAHFPSLVTAPITVAESGSLTLTLPAPADLRVRFHDALGADVTGVVVALEDREGHPVSARVGPEARSLSTWSTGSGSIARASELPAEVPLVLVAAAPGGQKTRTPFVLAANEMLQLDVALP
jgi:protocatechuate 3,4-dioxygenase beta subunit